MAGSTLLELPTVLPEGLQNRVIGWQPPADFDLDLVEFYSEQHGPDHLPRVTVTAVYEGAIIGRQLMSYVDYCYSLRECESTALRRLRSRLGG
jgi:hypothetical protein